jgi:L-lysine 6-transaminase
VYSRVAIPDYLPHAFFISGGALAVENALKTAFDWKVRKNFAKGYSTERGHQIMHFREAFHGRSGYTLSMTNTADPRKTQYFPKFDWPRVLNPKVTFPLDEENLAQVKQAEETSINQIKQAIKDNPDDIAAIIIEPIQGEGGDNHFRPEFFAALRTIADENDILLIFDEVQTGVGVTGKMWAYQHYGVEPDIVSFGKKTVQIGIIAGFFDGINHSGIDNGTKGAFACVQVTGEINDFGFLRGNPLAEG